MYYYGNALYSRYIVNFSFFKKRARDIPIENENLLKHTLTYQLKRQPLLDLLI